MQEPKYFRPGRDAENTMGAIVIIALLMAVGVVYVAADVIASIIQGQ